MKLLFTILATVVMLSTAALAKEKVYLLNNGPQGSSGSVIYAAMAESLKDTFDVTVVDLDGCAKVNAAISKLPADANILTDSLIKNIKKKEECNFMLPTQDNIMWIYGKTGLVFKRKDRDVSLFDPDIKIAYNKGRYYVVDEIDKTDNYVEYKKSGQIISSVVSGETDIGIINSPNKVLANSDLEILYVTTPDDYKMYPSITTVGGKTMVSSISYVWFGDANVKNQLKEALAAAYADSTTPLGLRFSGITGETLSIDKSYEESYSLYSQEAK